MHRCYVPQADFGASVLEVSGEEAHHALRVMRLRVGDSCEVFDGCGQAAQMRVVSTAGSSSMSLQVEKVLPPMPPVASITLALAIPKGNNMDLIVQKAVELGASRIIPLITERTIVRLNAKESATKAEKWRRTALEACKQCGVNTLPDLPPPAWVPSSCAWRRRCSWQYPPPATPSMPDFGRRPPVHMGIKLKPRQGRYRVARWWSGEATQPWVMYQK